MFFFRFMLSIFIVFFCFSCFVYCLRCVYMFCFFVLDFTLCALCCCHHDEIQFSNCQISTEKPSASGAPVDEPRPRSQVVSTSRLSYRPGPCAGSGKSASRAERKWRRLFRTFPDIRWPHLPLSRSYLQHQPSATVYNNNLYKQQRR